MLVDYMDPSSSLVVNLSVLKERYAKSMLSECELRIDERPLSIFSGVLRILPARIILTTTKTMFLDVAQISGFKRLIAVLQ